ncbi:endonuclease/exonuclease/phosphatase family protein [Nonomuraea pusilla]|uniref:endonuclease/exonuclease/phosphatase family protein n=1 Tax=Nonomuraea pusilla TaxID=46177 RepID=UPI0033338E56
MSTTVETAQASGGRRTGTRRRRRWMSWVVVGFLAAWAVIRAGGLEWGSFVTQLMTLTPYGAIAALVTAAVLALRRNLVRALVALVSCAVLAVCVLPRAFVEDTTTQGTPLRVLSINLFGRADAQAVVDLVRRLQPDVFSALELTHGEAAALDAAGIRALLPYQVLQTDYGATGSGLYARHPLTELPHLFTPVGHNMPAAAMTLPGGARVEVVAIHPNPPLGRMADEWYRALAALPAPTPDAVRVLAGDFNASLDHRALRALLGRGYVDAAVQAGKGLVPTWPNGRLVPPMITIDHVLVDERAGVGAAEILDVPRTDHRGVFAELRLPASLSEGRPT